CHSTNSSEPTTKSAASSDSSAAAVATAREEYPQPQDGSLRSYIELARRDIQLEKASIIADNLPLTEAEAAEFWPIYREYEADIYQINSRRLEVIRKFLPTAGDLTDERAKSLAKEVFDIDDKRVGLKKKYFSKFQEAVPATKAARFFQIENQLNMIL